MAVTRATPYRWRVFGWSAATTGATTRPANDVTHPAIGWRIAIAIAIGIAAGTLVFTFALRSPRFVTDFDQLYAAARALRAGADPWTVVGPGREFRWGWRLYYTLPAIALVAPLSYLPLAAARGGFAAIGSALLAFAFTRERWGRLLVFLGGAMAVALLRVQWSPLLTGAALLAPLSWLWIAKPTIGLATVIGAAPSAATAIRRVAMGVVVLAIATAVWPWWVAEWLRAIATATDSQPPLLRLGGPLILLALLRWRRPEARLLVALACVPQTGDVYETVPLFLVPESRTELLLLALLTHAARAVFGSAFGWAFDDGFGYTQMMVVGGAINNLVVYLPCVVMILRRPNDGTAPRWATRMLDRSLADLAPRLSRRVAPSAGSRQGAGGGSSRQRGSNPRVS